MAKVKFRGDYLTVVKSEQFVLPRGSTELQVEISNLTYTLEFEGGMNSDPRVTTVESGGTSARLRFQNFANSLGTSFDSRVGTLNGKNLHLAVMVHAVTKGDDAPDCPRLVSVTFYEGAQDG